MLDNLFDINELFRRAVKYIVEGIMVLLPSLIPQKPLKVEETILIALTAMTTFSILDAFVPSIAVSARQVLVLVLVLT